MYIHIYVYTYIHNYNYIHMRIYYYVGLPTSKPFVHSLERSSRIRVGEEALPCTTVCGVVNFSLSPLPGFAAVEPAHCGYERVPSAGTTKDHAILDGDLEHSCESAGRGSIIYIYIYVFIYLYLFTHYIMY